MGEMNEVGEGVRSRVSLLVSAPSGSVPEGRLALGGNAADGLPLRGLSAVFRSPLGVRATTLLATTSAIWCG